MKLILYLLKDILIFVFFIAILTGSILGAKLPFQFPVRSVGVYQIADFTTGLAFYQLQRKSPFYSLSPLNDYYLDENGYRNVYLTPQDFEEENFEIPEKKSKPKQTLLAIQSYLGLHQPRYSMETDDLEVTYTSQIEQNTITVTKTTTFPRMRRIQGQGMTLSFNSGDIIFNPKSGQLLSDVSPDDFQRLNALYPYTFQRLASPLADTITVAEKQIAVINPLVSGIVLITASENQQLKLNSRYSLIEIEERQEQFSDTMSMSMDIQISHPITDDPVF